MITDPDRLSAHAAISGLTALARLRGIDRALCLFAGLRRKYKSLPTLLRIATIYLLPGYVSIDRGDVLQTTALDVRDGRIAAIYIVRNPGKLRHLTAAFGANGHLPLGR